MLRYLHDQEFQASRASEVLRNWQTTGINAQHASSIRILLARLNVAINPKDLDAPGFYLHELKGKRKNTWSLRVNKNWRVTFTVVDGDVVDVDLADYH